jgi:hypothetical protein
MPRLREKNIIESRLALIAVFFLLLVPFSLLISLARSRISDSDTISVMHGTTSGKIRPNSIDCAEKPHLC